MLQPLRSHHLSASTHHHCWNPQSLSVAWWKQNVLAMTHKAFPGDVFSPFPTSFQNMAQLLICTPAKMLSFPRRHTYDASNCILCLKNHFTFSSIPWPTAPLLSSGELKSHLLDHLVLNQVGISCLAAITPCLACSSMIVANILHGNCWFHCQFHWRASISWEQGICLTHLVHKAPEILLGR